ncbi:hypothetical protein BIW11_02536 [Tropilaelaps mercedesae]|uniref:Uncharacterized protein n=1 Tax=Tropilaelaps mercedesae TaxID=418985 RepID=A0A1V9Y1E0_9ACAR|nr:hypothetical protein BIW11_02536 [Tropilaelaps mercedesae]
MAEGPEGASSEQDDLSFLRTSGCRDDESASKQKSNPPSVTLTERDPSKRLPANANSPQ